MVYMSHFDVFVPCQVPCQQFFRLNLNAKVAREIYFYFTYPIDVNVTLHLKLQLNMIAVNNVYQG